MTPETWADPIVPVEPRDMTTVGTPSDLRLPLDEGEGRDAARLPKLTCHGGIPLCDIEGGHAARSA